MQAIPQNLSSFRERTPVPRYKVLPCNALYGGSASRLNGRQSLQRMRFQAQPGNELLQEESAYLSTIHV